MKTTVNKNNNKQNHQTNSYDTNYHIIYRNDQGENRTNNFSGDEHWLHSYMLIQLPYDRAHDASTSIALTFFTFFPEWIIGDDTKRAL